MWKRLGTLGRVEELVDDVGMEKEEEEQEEEREEKEEEEEEKEEEGMEW